MTLQFNNSFTEAPYRGFIDELTSSGIRGWIARGDNRTVHRLSVEIDGVQLGQTTVNLPRPDVSAALNADGNFGFELRFDRSAIVSGLTSGALIEARTSRIVSLRLFADRSDLDQKSGANALSPTLVMTLSMSFAGWLEHFGLQLVEEIYQSRKPVYARIASAIDPKGADLKSIAREQEPELVATSLIWREHADFAELNRREIVGRYFDGEYYLRQYEDVRNADADPLEHYLQSGCRENRNPHPLFDAKFYVLSLNQLADDRKHLAASDPFYFFLKFGAGLDADPHLGFWMGWYRTKYHLPARLHPWIDYISGGWNFGREPNPGFDSQLFFAKLGSVLAQDKTPLAVFFDKKEEKDLVPHYMFCDSKVVFAGQALNKKSSDDYLAFLHARRSSSVHHNALFDAVYYRKNIDVVGGLDRLLIHYFVQGEISGFKPNYVFDPIWYRKKYRIISDIKGPLLDYLASGEAKLRDPGKYFSTRYYLAMYKDVALAGMHLLKHFLVAGDRERRRPNKRFDPRWYERIAKLNPSDQPFRQFLNSPLGASPHPAVLVNERASASELREWLYGEPEAVAGRPPFGVRTVFEIGTGQSEAAVPHIDASFRSIDEFEDSVTHFDPQSISKLRMNETIVRSYPYFDLADANRLQQEVRRRFEKTAREQDLPLVTVIMPARNRQTVVLRAVSSVMRQTYTNLELVVVDDGSTDGTVNRVATVLDARIKLIEQPHSGVSAARNKGLETATGTYIFYLDTDNYWEPSFVEIMVKSMIIENVDAAHAALRVYNDRGQIYYRGDVYDKAAMDRENYIDMNVFGHHRRFVDEGFRFDESLTRCVDWDLIRRISLKSPSYYVAFPGCNYVDDSGELQRITNTELVGDFYKLSTAQMDLDSQITGHKKELPPKYSIIWPIQPGEHLSSAEQVWEAVRHLSRGEHELIIINNALPDALTALLAELSTSVRGLRVVHLWRTFMFFPASNLGAKLACSENLLFWDGRVGYDGDRIDSFMSKLSSASDVVFPVVVDSEGKAIDGMFTVSHDAAGIQAVAGKQVIDRRIGDASGIAAQHFPVAIRKGVFERLNGFSSNLCLDKGLVGFVLSSWRESARKVVMHFGSQFVAEREKSVCGTSIALAREQEWFAQTLGRLPTIEVSFKNARLKVDTMPQKYVVSNGLLEVAAVALPTYSRTTRSGSQSVQIRCPAPAGQNSHAWGDYHFALSLKTSFERLGHRCEVRLRDHWDYPTHDADIVLHLRGIVDVKAVPGALNLLWLISHPDKLRASELEGMAGIVVCSQQSQLDLRQRFGVSSTVLPQATDARRFSFLDDATVTSISERFLFVGNSRREPRQIVLDSVKMNLPLDIYGQDWEYFVERSYMRGEHIDNANLPHWYRSALCVLNDHWPSMARAGIISNRLFDVVACGGVAITDEVAGIEQIFGPHVKVYSNAGNLKDLTDGVYDWMPPIEQRRAMSAELLSNHSFDRRARQLLEYVS
ncbi:UDP-Glc:alpha-D-GlcNAc-diphosphoundecaprenol beta-1,3-glucosyltransferase WfgD [Ensifer adhaerens]|uniref:glycosyltransferase n=1 Tax=Ensifer adhaerens TaxID=106592 RepID=UPI00156946D5|nr:glycosyltransferase [Ensifer adhaerens]NRP21072.1 UDP-Glc:alpha-D-GlcNAc-diphosphoundecaprenol beta-1,3-glucosyltransferase WfgD [Ensifer adhaerens]